ncbi:Protein of unknown function DUF3082 [Dillenia turbinata]|uniref:Transmembrane protein n=1 Tax=Dillenia turbinata TaxID=194707 RepID=A0AAN8W5L7_9MAGN
MLMSQHLLSSNISFSLSHHHNPLFHFPSSFPSTSPSLRFLHRPTSVHLNSGQIRAIPEQWLAQTTELTSSDAPDDGPVELPSSIFATSDNPTPLQVATSVLLTGAISLFLFRSVRRRAKRAKEMKFRSSGAKTLKEEAVDSLKVIAPLSVEAKAPPSPVQAFLGAFAAGVIALILYKFTITVEAALNRQAISDNYSVRQITITVRTIINGLCYLATFVFGANSLGLFLYSGQLALNSFMGNSSEDNKNEGKEQKSTSDSEEKSPIGGTELTTREKSESSDDTQ